MSTLWTLKALERAVVHRIRLVADAREVLVGELVGVEDQHAALLEVADVGLQCRGVHRDEEHVGLVAGCEHLLRRDMHLKARDAAGFTAGADLGGEVRKGRQVVAGAGPTSR